MLEFIGLCTIIFLTFVFFPQILVLLWNLIKIVAVLAVVLTVFVILGY